MLNQNIYYEMVILSTNKKFISCSLGNTYDCLFRTALFQKLQEARLIVEKENLVNPDSG